MAAISKEPGLWTYEFSRTLMMESTYPEHLSVSLEGLSQLIHRFYTTINPQPVVIRAL